MTPERVLFSSGVLSHGFLLTALMEVMLSLFPGDVFGKEAAECGIVVVGVIGGMERRGENMGVLLKLLLLWGR